LNNLFFSFAFHTHIVGALLPFCPMLLDIVYASNSASFISSATDRSLYWQTRPFYFAIFIALLKSFSFLSSAYYLL